MLPDGTLVQTIVLPGAIRAVKALPNGVVVRCHEVASSRYRLLRQVTSSAPGLTVWHASSREAQRYPLTKFFFSQGFLLGHSVSPQQSSSRSLVNL